MATYCSPAGLLAEDLPLPSPFFCIVLIEGKHALRELHLAQTDGLIGPAAASSSFRDRPSRFAAKGQAIGVARRLQNDNDYWLRSIVDGLQEYPAQGGEARSWIADLEATTKVSERHRSSTDP